MTARSRLCVLGLDGLSLDIANFLAPHCPNLATITTQAGTLRSELPELSPVNWTSFFTGKGPEKHGIYGFTSINPQTYQLFINNFTQVACPTLFDSLGQRAKISKSINLPTTFPARSLRGMMISGFVATDIHQAVYPRFLASALGDYLLEADTLRGASDSDYLLQELRKTLASRSHALDLLWPDLEWDLFIFVLTETDRLFHFFLPAVLDAHHPLHHDLLAFLRDWDTLIGQFFSRYKALPEPKRLLVLADHGFCNLKIEVDINVWLKQHAHLILHASPASEWDASHIAPQTTAFALDPGRIYLHCKETFPKAQYQRLELAPLLPKLIEELMLLRWQGQPVFKKIFLKEELYGTTPTGLAPDLICEANAGFELKAKFNRQEVFGHFGRFGTHTANGALFFDSQGEQAHLLRDTGQIILKHFGL